MPPRFSSLNAPCSDFQSAHRLTRRQVLHAGGVSLLGLGLPHLLAAQATAKKKNGAPSFGKAKACILLFMWGGPSQLDTWDPKPEAPAEVRGEFKSIVSCVPGIRISEHFPRLARRANRYTIIRSMSHDDPAHLSSVHHVLTGRHAPRVKSDAEPPSRKDSPHIGSVLAYLRPTRHPIPPFVTMPWLVSHPAAPGGVAPGQNGGWLGQAYDPFVVTADPNNPMMVRVPGLAAASDISKTRLDERTHLLTQLDLLQATTAHYSVFQHKALALVSSATTRRAFALDREPAAVRDRYGRHVHGQCLLLARRLIEAGVRLVEVNWQQDGRFFWDTHGNNFNRLKNDLMPPADQAFSALLDDLAERGLLDETLVVWVGEFGRKPIITRNSAGREHHPWCYSAVLAGGGIRCGHVYGKSDRSAAYPAENPVSPADLTATVYHGLGINPERRLADREGRVVPLIDGSPVMKLFD